MQRHISEGRSAQYYALIEPLNEPEEGEEDRGAPLLIDAIPVDGAKNYLESGADLPSLDFLLAYAEEGRGPTDQPLYETIQLITLSDTPSNGAIPVSTAVLDDRGDGEREQLFMTIEKMSPQDVEVCGTIGRFSVGKPASEAGIRKLLKNAEAGAPHGIAIYDVGQANFNAVVDCNEHPRLFFDFGRPIGLKARTKPLLVNFNPLAFNHAEPVVLSHLDQDHWLFAVESGRAAWDSTEKYWKTAPKYRDSALQRKWIVRLPEGVLYWGSHIHFLRTLASNGSLFVWPEGSVHIQGASIGIWSCSPSAGSPNTQSYLKNNSSLALRVESARAVAVLCGDAEYGSFDSNALDGVTAVVAPHHGGYIQFGATPNVRGPGRMVLSTYENAYPSVPHDQTIADALNNGWFVTRTDARHSCGRCGNVHGHKYIPLAGTQPECGCGVVTSAQICLPHVQ